MRNSTPETSTLPGQRTSGPRPIAEGGGGPKGGPRGARGKPYVSTRSCGAGARWMEGVTWHGENPLVYYGRLLLRNGLLITSIGLIQYAVGAGDSLSPGILVAIILGTDAVITTMTAFWFQPRKVGTSAEGIVIQRALGIQRIPWPHAHMLINEPPLYRLAAGWVVAWTESSYGPGQIFLNGSSVDFLRSDPRLDKRDWTSERKRLKRERRS
jgi:hypothetical protein